METFTFCTYRIIYTLLVLVNLVSIQLFSITDSNRAHVYFQKGESFFEQAQYDSSLYYIERAKIFFKKDEDWQYYIRSRIILSSIFSNTQKKEDALSVLQESLDIAKYRLGETDPLVATIYNDLGMIHGDIELHREAIQFHKKALSIQLKIFGEKHRDVSDSYNNIGVAYWYLADHAKVRRYFTKALELRKELFGENHPLVAQSLTNIGVSLREDGKYNDALYYFYKALEIRRNLYNEDHPQVANSYNQISTIYDHMGNYFNALDYYRKAFNIRKQTLGENHPAVASSYNNIANQFAKSGDYGQALNYHHRALSIRIDVLGEQSGYVANSYQNIGDIYMRIDNYGEALKHFRKAREIYIERLGETHPSIAQVHTLTGLMYRRKGEYAKALQHNYKALEIFLNIYGKEHGRTAYTFHNIGYIYEKMGSYEEALEFYKKSLSIDNKLFGDRHPSVADLHTHIASVYRMTGNLVNGLQQIDRALAILWPDFAGTVNQSEYVTVNIIRDTYFLNALHTRGIILQEIYRHDDTDLKPLLESLETYKIAVLHIDNMQKLFISEESKHRLGNVSKQVFEQAIETSLLLFEATAEISYKDLAFEFAEKSKSAVLRETVAESRARSFASVPEILLDRERKIRQEIGFYNIQRMKYFQDSEKERKYRNKLFFSRERHLELIGRIEENYPRYYELKYQTQTASIKNIRKHLDDETAILQYFIGEYNIFIFAISKEDIAIKRVPATVAIDDLCTELIRSIRIIDPVSYTTTASALYDLLIKPVEQVIASKSDLLIIPDGSLYNIPFEILLNTAEAHAGYEWDFTTLPFLIRDFSISYHYSTTLYLNTLSGNQYTHKGTDGTYTPSSFIGFAPVHFQPHTGYAQRRGDISVEAGYTDPLDEWPLTPLPYSEKEIRSIAKLMNDNNIPARTYLFDEANKNTFLSDANNPAIIHIASHGIVNPQFPGLSGIVFAPNDESVNFEMMYIKELYNLDLQADLVVIGSCESGYGEILRGEGLMSMTRGLLYSGSSNIIVSLWEIYDRYSKDITIRFYEEMLSGNSFARSLRASKLGMIENEATAFPIFWSSMVLIGK